MSNGYLYANQNKGFSLLELLVSIVILALLLGIAIPSYKNFIEQKRLKTATEDLYDFIKVSQSRGLNLPSSYYMSMTPGANWCYGLSDTAPCDCTIAGNCTVAGIATSATSTDYAGNTLSLATTGFSGTATDPYIIFEGRRGTITSTGTITLTSANTGESATIGMNQQGLVTVCGSDTVRGYPTCP